MNEAKSTNYKNGIVDIVLVLFIISIFYSKFLLSVSMILLVLAALVKVRDGRIVGLSFNLRGFIRDHRYSALTLVFFGVCLSGVVSSDIGNWIHHVKMKLPFLLMPIAFFGLPRISTQRFVRFMLIFIGCSFISSMPVLINYISHFEEVNNEISRGGAIPVPIHHIRYSIVISFAVMASIIMALEYRKVLKSKVLLVALIAIGIYLFSFIHVLAVRTGIIVLYACIVFLIFRYVVTHKKYMMALIALGALALVPIIVYNAVPSIKKKVGYMLYDMDRFMEGGGQNYSDGGRIYSLKVGLDVFKEHPILGAGIGDLKDVCAEKYVLGLEQSAQYAKYPHNQFVFTLAGCGVIGLLIFLWGFYFPFFKSWGLLDPFIWGIYIMFSLSFLVDDSLEMSVSTAFFLIMLLVRMSNKR